MPVFVTENKTPLTHGSISMQLKRLAKRAGVEKHVTPHIFRHSRITHLIKEKVSESVIKLMMWGSLNTEMFQTYAHLTGSDIDSEILRTYGISVDKKNQENGHERLEPRQCKGCFAINSPTSHFCSHCGRSLTEEAIASETQMQSSVLDTPEAIQAYVNELVERKM
jgi:molybdenum cofactor biosynthesis enzyme MoaA